MVNDYDSFAEERHAEFEAGTNLAHRFVEKPMMRSMLPDLKNKKVLLLGCGTGDESELIKLFRAKEIVGIDISSQSIALARELYKDCTFMVADMHKLPFENESFDFVYSSLTIHYSGTPREVFKEIYRVLKPGGQLLFSVGHPVRFACELSVGADGEEHCVIGYKYKSSRFDKIGNYLTFSKHLHAFGPNKNELLEFFTAPPSMWFKFLKEANFNVLDFKESKCTEEVKQSINPTYYNAFSEIPQFIGFLAQKI